MQIISFLLNMVHFFTTQQIVNILEIVYYMLASIVYFPMYTYRQIVARSERRRVLRPLHAPTLPGDAIRSLLLWTFIVLFNLGYVAIEQERRLWRQGSVATAYYVRRLGGAGGSPYSWWLPFYSIDYGFVGPVAQLRQQIHGLYFPREGLGGHLSS